MTSRKFSMMYMLKVCMYQYQPRNGTFQHHWALQSSSPFYYQGYQLQKHRNQQHELTTKQPYPWPMIWVWLRPFARVLYCPLNIPKITIVHGTNLKAKLWVQKRFQKDSRGVYTWVYKMRFVPKSRCTVGARYVSIYGSRVYFQKIHENLVTSWHLLTFHLVLLATSTTPTTTTTPPPPPPPTLLLRKTCLSSATPLQRGPSNDITSRGPGTWTPPRRSINKPWNWKSW